MTFVPTLITGAGPMNTTTTPMGGLALMRRPALHHPHTSLSGWSHPYAPNPHTFYADGGDDPTPGSDGAAADPPKPGPPAGKVFTQADLDEIAAREKAQGKRAGARTALEEFAKDNGFGSADDAKAFIEAAREAQQAQLSEQEKQVRKVEEDRKTIEADRAALAAERRTIRLEQALTRLGAVDSTDDQGEEVPNLQDAMAVLERELRNSGDDSPEAAATAAQKIKARRPELFGIKPAAAPSSLPPAPGGAPAGGPPSRPASTGKPGDRGREMARIRGHLKNTA